MITTQQLALAKTMATSQDAVIDSSVLPAPTRRYTTLTLILLLVLALHVLALSAVFSPHDVVKKAVVKPTIVGVLVAPPAKPIEAIKTSEKIEPLVKKTQPVEKPKPSEPKLMKAPKPQLVPAPKPQLVPAPIPQPEPVITPELKAETAPQPVETVADVETKTVSAELISPPHSDAKHLNNPPPVYPRTALRLGQEGTVVLRLLVRADGSVDELAIKTSSGIPRLDKAALKSVKRWRYVPAMQSDEAIDYWYEQPIVFSLRK